MATRPMILLLCILVNFHISISQSWIKAGYWHYQSELPVSEINSALFTHLLCAFAYINNSTYQISFNSNYQHSFSTFTDIVRLKNPSVITVLSIWVATDQSQIFSSMINQFSSRKSFIHSSIETARRYGLQGLDLFGSIPGNNTNMTKLGNFLDEWHAAVVSEARSSRRPQLLLAMTDFSISLTHGSGTYPVASMKRNLDWIHVAAYDYYLPTRDNFTGPHAALYAPSSRWTNANRSINEWISRRFSPNKLVFGIPYHGYAWTLANPSENYIGAPASGPSITIDGSAGYKLIKSYIQKYGYGVNSVYNDTFALNFASLGPSWINFDGVKGIRAKISFAKEKGLLGYAVFQLANDDNWELSSAASKEDDDQQKKQHLLKIILIIVAITFVLLLAAVVYFLQRRVLRLSEVTYKVKRSVSRWMKKTSTENLHKNATGNLQVFDFTTIKVATNDFAEENKLGKGGYGPVYKGRLATGQEIAVKRLSENSRQGLEEFKNEVGLTARLQHVNLVPVLGICTEGGEKMLIYEYMPNKNLNFYIFDPYQRHLLNWEKRIHVIEGVIQGLLYLQEYSNFTIVHRDLKGSNILLDKEMNPKISDFGIARAFTKDEGEANTSHIIGTYGYVPPEYVRKGIYSMKYDVYSFGVLLLQIISGKRNTCYYGPYGNLNLLEYAYKLWKEDKGNLFFDSSLDDSSSTWKILQCMHVGLLCVQENPADRPTMLQVLSMLKNETTTVTIPKEPAFSIKRDDEKESECSSNINLFTSNDATITELGPR